MLTSPTKPTNPNRSVGGGVIPTNRSLSTEEAAAHALERLKVLFRYPDDLLSNLEILRKKTTSEKAAVDAQLKSATQSQLNDCQTGLDNLDSVTKSLGSGRDMLASVHANGVKSIGMIPSFTRVQKLAVIHSNFRATHKTLVQFQVLNDRVAQLDGLIKQHHRDLQGPAPDLLYMHHELFQLESFREATLKQTQGLSKDTITTVHHYFRRLDEVSVMFNAYIWDLARHILELVRGNRPDVIVRLAKILEFEETADQARLTGSPSDQAHREPKNFRSRFFDVVHESISARFSVVFDRDRQVPEMLGTTHDMVINDLTEVYDDLVNLFPKTYKLFPFFVLEYHRHVYDLINKIILEKMETGTILFILRWCGEYYTDMNDKLGVAEELLEPRILDGQERVLVEDYLKLIRTKLDEWLKNLLNSETTDFMERNKPPESDSQGMYGLSASIILFNMVNQQIDIVLESSHGELLLDVIKECTRVLAGYQTHFSNLVLSESKEFFNDTANKCPPGLLDYTIALSNDSLKCTEFVELIIQRLEPISEDKVQKPIAQELNKSMDGFMKVAKTACGVLIDMAFADLKQPLSQLFGHGWYKEEPMNNIIATLNDYCADFREHLQDYLFGKLITDIMDKFAIAWIETMRHKNTKFYISQYPQTPDLMSQDHATVVEMFSQFKSPKRVAKAFDVIDRLFRILCANRKMIYLDVYALTKAYSDIPLQFIEDMISKRDDLDKPGLKEIIEGIRVKYKQSQNADGSSTAATTEKSVFSTIFPPK